MGAVTPLRSVGAAEEEEEREGGAGGGGGEDALCVWIGWLMSGACRGCNPCSGPAGTPLGHLSWHVQTDTLCKHPLTRSLTTVAQRAQGPQIKHNPEVVGSGAEWTLSPSSNLLTNVWLISFDDLIKSQILKSGYGTFLNDEVLETMAVFSVRLLRQAGMMSCPSFILCKLGCYSCNYSDFHELRHYFWC